MTAVEICEHDDKPYNLAQRGEEITIGSVIRFRKSGGSTAYEGEVVEEKARTWIVAEIRYQVDSWYEGEERCTLGYEYVSETTHKVAKARLNQGRYGGNKVVRPSLVRTVEQQAVWRAEQAITRKVYDDRRAAFQAARSEREAEERREREERLVESKTRAWATERLIGAHIEEYAALLVQARAEVLASLGTEEKV